MGQNTWKDRVEAALARLDNDRWSAPVVRYMEIIDDVAAGNGSVADIARRAGSPDLVDLALDRVNAALLGGDAAPALAQGGWYERDGETYRVAPDFAAHWASARAAQRQVQAFQAL